jgi:phytoene dehydrogenase-like protein
MHAMAHDAIVVGSGPNGLAAAITLARAGRSVLVLERRATVGGGSRSAELTLPGFVHDVCSAVHPLVLASPFFRSLPLQGHGLRMIQPPLPLAHPLEGGSAAIVERSVEATAARLGADGRAWRGIFEPLVRHAGDLLRQILGPLRPPRHPLVFTRFALTAAHSARGLARSRFRDPAPRALIAGIAAHSMLALEHIHTSGYALVLGGLAQWVGWPIAVGGSQSIADALASYLRSLGGEIRTDAPVDRIDELPPARAILCDISVRDLLRIAGDRFSPPYRAALRRFRYGPGVFKIDWALEAPIPWAASECRRAGTVHVGGTLDEIAAGESAVTQGRHAERPFVLVAQPSLFDDSRAPAGKHTAWAYCHVPPGSTQDMTDVIEGQIQRFAPGFRDVVLGRAVMGPAALEAYNPNYVGGDINGGLQDIRQLYTRPAMRLDPYSTPARDIYLCSSATPPGGGVHGMCGYWAARSALRRAW